MEQIISYKDSEIVVDEKNGVSIPLDVQIRILNKRKLKAVAKLTYAGLVINDINIIENRGRIDIVFPQKEVNIHGVTKYISVVFPCVRDLSSQFNHAILKAYSDAMLKSSNETIENAVKE